MTAQSFGPYSPIRKAGDAYYVSGQVGVNPETKTASSDVSEQTRRVLENMRAVLQTEGLSMNDVVKCGIFVTDIGDFAKVNAVYETFFEAPRPARSTVCVNELPRVAGNTPILIEIDAVAYRG